MRRLYLLCLVCAVFCLAACGSSDPYVCVECTSVPDAQPADDGLSTGVYKGILVGESTTGTLMATILTNQSDGTCTIVKDGVTFTSTGFTATQGSWIYTFTGDGFVFALHVSDTGVIEDDSTLTFDGDPVEVVLAKEESSRMVECFNGEWSGDGYSGFWNFVIFGEQVIGRYDGSDSGGFEGTIDSGGHIDVKTLWEEDLAWGDRNMDGVSGRWEYYDNSGGWSGERRL